VLPDNPIQVYAVLPANPIQVYAVLPLTDASKSDNGPEWDPYVPELMNEYPFKAWERPRSMSASRNKAA
jgi:hypothetical protein